jgi:hypothetical protein
MRFGRHSSRGIQPATKEHRLGNFSENKLTGMTGTSGLRYDGDGGSELDSEAWEAYYVQEVIPGICPYASELKAIEEQTGISKNSEPEKRRRRHHRRRKP